MSTLIIPCAGRSSRFPNMRPKWMLYYPDGKIMVQKAIDGLDIGCYERVIITILKEHVIRHRADRILQTAFCIDENSKFELCILENHTSCQAETVYLTLEKCNVTGAFAVKDSDNYIEGDYVDKGDFVAGLNVTSFTKEIRRLAAKSFLILNEQNIITDIIEKKIVSEYVCVGLYGFRDTELFKEAYLHLSSVSEKKYEIFVSHIIAYLIGMRKSVYEYVETKEYEDWGTIDEWNNVLNEKSTIIINIDQILFEADDEGAENEPFKMHSGLKKENVEILKRYSDHGAQLIILTARRKEERLEIMDILAHEGITVHALITDCYLSHEILINSFGEDLPYPGCSHINIGKKGKLEDYIRI